MENVYNSAFIFDLIKEHGLFERSGDLKGFPEGAFSSFCKKYRIACRERDTALLRYLNTTPNLFRCHLPYSRWAFGVSLNVVWYYDELVIGDPILQLINSKDIALSDQSEQLQRLLAFLATIEQSVKGGYILFIGNHYLKDDHEQMAIETDSLIKQPEILSNYEQMTAFLKKPSPINDDPSDNLTQLDIQYEGLVNAVRTMGTYIPQHVFDEGKLTNGVSYDFMTPFQWTTKEDFMAMEKADMLEAITKEYRNDINLVLETVANSYKLNAPALFYREADYLAAKNFTAPQQQKTAKIQDRTVYDCLVPYVHGIPPERLFDIKNEMPAAFLEFRNYAYDIVNKAMKSTDDTAELKYAIDKEIQSKMRLLKTELENAKYKWRFNGIATPLVVLTGSMGLFTAGINYADVGTALLGSGGLIKMISTWAEVRGDKNKSALNPVYFLWKAQQDPGGG